MNKLDEFLNNFKSLVISSLDENGFPFTSYAVFVRYENKYYVYLSDIANHSHNLRRSPKASIFFAQDEQDCEKIFARKRVVYQVDTKVIDKSSDTYKNVIDIFMEKEPNTFSMLVNMSDFNLYEFTPSFGQAVFGFGAAYDIGGENFNELVERKSNGNGHGHGSK